MIHKSMTLEYEPSSEPRQVRADLAESIEATRAALGAQLSQVHC